jgi:uncharacterized lipoprotein YbaY
MILSDDAYDLPLAAFSLRDDPAAMLSAQVIVRPGQEPYKFGMNQPGLDNQQFALNEMRWLVGQPK